MNTNTIRPAFAMWMLWVAAAITMVLLYSRGLPGDFIFDDAYTIRDNPYVAITDLSAESLQQGWNASPFPPPLNRPLSFLSFSLHHAFSGNKNPADFKLVNIIIHLINGALLLLFLRRLLMAANLSGSIQLPETKQIQIAGATAILWLLHPILLTSVLYSVQRMTSLSGLFVLLGLVMYTGMRLRQLQDKPSKPLLTAIGISTALILGVLSKENAVLLPAFILAIEWTLLRSKKSSTEVNRALLYFLVGLAVSLLAVVAYVAVVKPGFILGGYGIREFTMTERLLSETRVLWMYIGQILWPTLDSYTLFHDDFVISKDLFTPLNTFVAVVCWVWLLILSLIFPARYPLLAFAVLFFLTGHALESTIIGLELVHEHRNYMAIIGPIVLIMAALLHFVREFPWQSILRWVALTWIIAAALVTGLRAKTWSDKSSLFQHMALNQPNSGRANFMAGIIYTSQIQPGTPITDPRFVAAQIHFENAAKSSEDDMNGWLGLLVLQLHAGQTVSDQIFNTTLLKLKSARYSPERLSLQQFRFLAIWLTSDGTFKLTEKQAHMLFQAALNNPTINGPARAAVASAYSFYLQHGPLDLKAALKQAQVAKKHWKENLRYHARIIELAIQLGNQALAENALRSLQDTAKHTNAVIEGGRLANEWNPQIEAMSNND